MLAQLTLVIATSLSEGRTLDACTLGSWAEPTEISVGDVSLLGNPQSAVRGDGVTYVVGNSPRLDNHTSRTSNVAFKFNAWRIDRSPGHPVTVVSIGAPPGVSEFINPIPVTDKNGLLHLVWGTRRATGDGAVRRSPNPKANALWQSVYKNSAWSNPEKIAEFEQMEWSAGDFVQPVSTPNGAIAMVVPISSESHGGGIGYVSWRRGVWHVDSVFPKLAVTPAYTAVATDGAENVMIAYIAGLPGHANSVNSVQSIRSHDGGKTWSDPTIVELSEGNPAMEPRITLRDGQVDLFWLQSNTTELSSAFLRHATSRDFGIKWSTVQSTDARGGRDLRAIIGPCGNLLAFFAGESSEYPTLHMARYKNEHWLANSSLFPTYFSVFPSVGVDDAGCVHLLWISAPADIMRKLPHARLTISHLCASTEGLGR